MDLAGWSIKLNLQIERRPAKKTKPVLQLTQFINNQLFIMADITISSGQVVGANLKLFDNVTGNEIPATFSNQQILSNDHPEFANFTINPSDNNRVNGQWVAAGAGTVVVGANASYTDPGDGSVHTDEPFTVTKTFETIGAPHGAHLDLQF